VQVFCTVSGAGSSALQPSIDTFDVALVDEAAQLVEAEASIILAVRDHELVIKLLLPKLRFPVGKPKAHCPKVRLAC